MPSTSHASLGSSRALVALAVASVALSGCTITAGQRGLLSFMVASTDEPLLTPDPSLAVAKGSTVTYVVTTHDGTPINDLSGARLNAASANSIVRIARSEVAVRFVNEGLLTLNVSSARGADSLVIRSREVDAARVVHWVSLLRDLHDGIPEPVFLQGSSARFILQTTDATGAPLIGFGVDPPLRGDPAGHIVITAEDGELAHVSVEFIIAGATTLQPLRGPAFEVDVLEDDAVESFELLVAPSPRRSDPSVRLVLATAKTSAGVRTLSSDRLVWSSTTPAACSLGAQGFARHLGEGGASVILLSNERCTVEASLGERRATVDISRRDAKLKPEGTHRQPPEREADHREKP